MKFRIPQESLSKALVACGKSLAVKANLPVLSNVLLIASKNKLEFVSTNLETATTVRVDCKVETEGKIAVVGKLLMEFAAALPPGEVLFEKLGEELLVSTEGYTARLSTMEASEFPAIPKIENGKSVVVDAHSFAKISQKVAFAAAMDEGRPILNGVLVEFGKKGFSLVATDGYRLSFIETELEGSIGASKIVIPAKALIEVGKIITEGLKEEGEKITITVAEALNQINFRIGEIEFTSRLIEGDFPNWQKIIPSNFITKARINREEFLKQIRVASIFARDAGNIVKLAIEGKVLKISATTNQVAGGEVKTEVEVEGKGGESAFNFRYLLEALSFMESEEIYFEIIESLTPARLTEVGENKNFFHIIMPVRLQG